MRRPRRSRNMHADRALAGYTGAGGCATNAPPDTRDRFRFCRTVRRFRGKFAMSTEIAYEALYLKRGEDARLRSGHLWVFSNEVDVARSPLTAFQPGAPCVL